MAIQRVVYTYNNERRAKTLEDAAKHSIEYGDWKIPIEVKGDSVIVDVEGIHAGSASVEVLFYCSDGLRRGLPELQAGAVDGKYPLSAHSDESPYQLITMHDPEKWPRTMGDVNYLDVVREKG